MHTRVHTATQTHASLETFCSRRVTSFTICADRSAGNISFLRVSRLLTLKLWLIRTDKFNRVSVINISTLQFWPQQGLELNSAKLSSKWEKIQANLIKLKWGFTLILFQRKHSFIDVFLVIRTSLEFLQRDNFIPVHIHCPPSPVPPYRNWDESERFLTEPGDSVAEAKGIFEVFGDGSLLLPSLAPFPHPCFPFMRLVPLFCLVCTHL